MQNEINNQPNIFRLGAYDNLLLLANGGKQMIIRIHDAAYCELHDSQLPDVVQLLGKDSFTFTLDQAQNHLNLMLPVNDYQVILETNDDRLAVLLVYIMSMLKQACFPFVYTVHTEKDRERIMSRINMEQPILWITFNEELDCEEWVVQYSQLQKKWSKHLAGLLVSHLSHEVPVRIQSEPIKWKSIVPPLRAQSEKQIPFIRMTCACIQNYTVDQIEEIANSLVRAVVSAYTNKPLLELLQAISKLEEHASKLNIAHITEAERGKEPEPLSEQRERVNMDIQEPQVNGSQQKMLQATSMFGMLRAHANGDKNGDKSPEQLQGTSSNPSFMTYMNQLSIANNKEKKQQQPYNIMLHQHNLKKSVNEK